MQINRTGLRLPKPISIYMFFKRPLSYILFKTLFFRGFFPQSYNMLGQKDGLRLTMIFFHN